MTALALKRATDKAAWEGAIEKFKIESEEFAKCVHQEADNLGSTAMTAVDRLGKELQDVRGNLADSKHREQVARKELQALMGDSRTLANLVVRISGLESELFELQKVHASLEVDMGPLKKRAKTADNLKLENARLKNGLSQPELPAEVKAAAVQSQKLDDLETLLQQASMKITAMECELNVSRKARDELTTVLGQKEVTLKKQEQVLVGARR